jgi:DNA-binding NtrC family response regulator
MDLLVRLKALDPGLPVIFVTGVASIEAAVKAIQSGADQFLTKPVDLPALKVIVQRLVSERHNRQMLRAGKVQRPFAAVDPFVGESRAIRTLEDEARLAATSGLESPILITGRTGSGKGVLAAWLHRNGARAAEPFIDINCAGLSRELLDSELFGHERGAFTGAQTRKQGLLEVADHGTVFLDEIEEMAPGIQAMLLKVLEEKHFHRLGSTRERHVDVRVIVATQGDLLERVRQGRFREDLYYRVNVLHLRVPELRERAEDIPILAGRILAGLAAELGRSAPRLTPDAESALKSRSWPGNIRELRNELERAMMMSKSATIELSDLLPGPRAPSAFADLAQGTLEEVERRYILHVFEAEDGHIERTVQRPGIARSSLYQRLKTYGVDTRR